MDACVFGLALLGFGCDEIMSLSYNNVKVTDYTIERPALVNYAKKRPVVLSIKSTAVVGGFGAAGKLCVEVRSCACSPGALRVWGPRWCAACNKYQRAEAACPHGAMVPLRSRA